MVAPPTTELPNFSADLLWSNRRGCRRADARCNANGDIFLPRNGGETKKEDDSNIIGRKGLKVTSTLDNDLLRNQKNEKAPYIMYWVMVPVHVQG